MIKIRNHSLCTFEAIFLFEVMFALVNVLSSSHHLICTLFMRVKVQTYVETLYYFSHFCYISQTPNKQPPIKWPSHTKWPVINVWKAATRTKNNKLKPWWIRKQGKACFGELLRTKLNGLPSEQSSETRGHSERGTGASWDHFKFFQWRHFGSNFDFFAIPCAVLWATCKLICLKMTNQWC